MAAEMDELRQKLIKETKEKVRKAYTRDDNHVIKAVSLLEDLDEVFNLMSEHAIDWYSMHFPELNRVVRDNEAYLKFIKLGERKNFNKDEILNFYADEEQTGKILALAKESMGSDISPESLKQMQALADNALKLKTQRKDLTDFIEKVMKKLAPNFSALCGATLAAKLLAQAGSLEKLASLPSSTSHSFWGETAKIRLLVPAPNGERLEDCSQRQDGAHAGRQTQPGSKRRLLWQDKNFC
jgi:nucleolar protein 56